jgi:C1A family cysteine protease
MFPFRDGNIYKQMFNEYAGLFDNNYENFISVMDKIEKRNNHSFLLIFYDNSKFVSINFDEKIIF